MSAAGAGAKGFPGGPEEPPYGYQQREAGSVPGGVDPVVVPPVVAAAPQRVTPTAGRRVKTPRNNRPSKKVWVGAGVGVVVVAVIALLVGLVGGSSSRSGSSNASSPPSTLRPPSGVVVPAASAGDPANCPGATTDVASPLPAAQSTAPGDVPGSGTGRLGALAWSIPLAGLDTPVVNPDPYYVLAVNSGVVVVTDATAAMGKPAIYVGLDESSGAVKWARSVPFAVAANVNGSLPVLSGGAVYFSYQEGGALRAAGLSLTTGAVVACVPVGSSSSSSIYPVSGGIYSLGYNSAGGPELIRLGGSGQVWASPGKYDTVLGGDATTVVVGQGLLPNYSSPGGVPAVVVGIDAGTGAVRWRTPVAKLSGSSQLVSYDTSTRPNGGGSGGDLAFSGDSYGLLDGVSQGGTTAFTWAATGTNLSSSSAKGNGVFLFAVNNADGGLSFGGWAEGSSRGVVAGGSNTFWMPVGLGSSAAQWVSVGPGGPSKGFPPTGYQIAAAGGLVVANDPTTASGAQYGTQVLAGVRGQVGAVSLDTTSPSSSSCTNGALSNNAWTALAGYNEVATAVAGQPRDYAIVSYKLSTSSGGSTGSPSAKSTVPPTRGAGGGNL